MAAQIEQILNAALAGERHGLLNVTSAEMLAEPFPVGRVIGAALARAGNGLTGQWRITEAFRLSGLSDELLNSLVSENPVTRAAAARLCGALRLTEAVLWIEDLVQDKNPTVREAAIRALGALGGRRAVDSLIASVDRIPVHRLAITLASAASDLDIEALMRQPASEKAAVVTVLACGLRHDALRVAPLLGIAHDKRWPKQVRIAACKSLGMIAHLSAADGLANLAEKEPDVDVKKAANLAHRRLLRSIRKRPA
ncbi:MAG: HEAT repeat domain-containing protein [Candidatus Dormibacteraceae bacterium]